MGYVPGRWLVVLDDCDIELADSDRGTATEIRGLKSLDQEEPMLASPKMKEALQSINPLQLGFGAGFGAYDRKARAWREPLKAALLE